MPNKDGRITEHEVAEAAARYLSAIDDGEATVATIVRNLPAYLELADADREQSVTRPNEEVWEQQVRNIISHRKTPGNFIYDGLLAYTKRGSLIDMGILPSLMQGVVGWQHDLRCSEPYTPARTTAFPCRWARPYPIRTTRTPWCPSPSERHLPDKM